MLFNSFSFLGSFAALALTYYALPHAWRWPLLLAASLGFYATFSAWYLLILFTVTLVTFAAGLAISAAPEGGKRVRLTGGVVAVLAALFVFKYYDFFAGTVDAVLGRPTPLLPRMGPMAVAGLSFYTFSSVAYLADVHAGRVTAERHPGHFALYVAFFPKLLAGPLERAAPVLERLRRPVAFDASRATSGLQLLLWGLFKKVVIADRLATFVDAAYRQPSFAAPVDLLLATYFFAFQLYCDFSGYSDMAIGSAKVLGFDFADNFRRPYLSTSVREFWSRRWHISLSTWFRDYMYIPLGGSHRSRIRGYVNLLAVFLVSGLWHGASWTFVVWGGLNGLFQIGASLTSGIRERLTSGLRGPAWLSTSLRRLITFHLILVTWVFFRAADLDDAMTVITRVLGSLPSLAGALGPRMMVGDVLLSIGLIAVLMGAELFDEIQPMWDRARRWPTPLRWAVYYALLAALVVMGSWTLQQFVYMQF